jgi:hypothetical protein
MLWCKFKKDKAKIYEYNTSYMTTTIQEGSVISESQLSDLVDGDSNRVNFTQVTPSSEKVAQVPYNDGTNRIKVIRATPSERQYIISIKTQEQGQQPQQAKRVKWNKIMPTTTEEEKPYLKNARPIRAKEYADELVRAFNYNYQEEKQQQEERK